MSTQFTFTNNANTTLASNISSGATTITISSSTHFPSSITSGQYLAVTLNDAATQSVFEVMYATAISGTSLTVIRGQEGTTATSWSAGDYVYCALTAGVLDTFVTTGSSQTITGTKIVDTAQFNGEPWYDVKAFGAKGDGTTDDTLAFQNWATALATYNGIGYIPASPSHYMIKTGAITISSAVRGIVAASGAFLDGTGASSTDCFVFGPNGSFYGTFALPNIVNFAQGAAVRLKGVGQTIISIPYVNGCKYGVQAETNNGSGYPNCVNNTVDFGVIANSSSAGIHVFPNSDSDTLQGNLFRGNYLLSNNYGIFYDKGAGTITNSAGACSINNFSVGSIDGVASTVTGVWGIYSNFPVFADSFNVPNYFDNFSTGMISLYTGSVGAKAILNTLNSIPLSYAAWVLTGANNFVMQRTMGKNGTNYTAETTANSRSAFNSGTPVYTGSIPVVFPFSTSSLAAGAVVTMYVYSPYVNGNNTRLRVQPTLNSSIAGLVVTGVVDNGATNANEIAITLWNGGSSTISSNESALLYINEG